MIVGYEDERRELNQLKEMLISYNKYQEKGIRIPRGVLLSGVPGVGKTEMVREVVKDGVNLVELKIQTFTEGELASKIEAAFKEAKEKTPCIIFIDELDKISVTNKNIFTSEMSKACKVLLGELDRLNEKDPLLVIATCNNRNSIPKPLIRCGRFDRLIQIFPPDDICLMKIIDYYLSKIDIKCNASAAELGRLFSHMTGAEIENYINDAAIIAIQKEEPVLELEDFKEAINKRMLSSFDKGPISDPKERHVLAVHEAGHAVCAMYLIPDEVDMVTIIPRGKSGGRVSFNCSDSKVKFVSYFKKRIAVSLSGRVSESLILCDTTNGSASDIEGAIALSKLIISTGEYGFEGCINSDVMGMACDENVNKLIGNCLKAQNDIAKNILEENFDVLNNVIKELELKNTLSASELFDIKRNTENSRKESSKDELLSA